MAYPFPRQFKDRVAGLPGSDILRSDRVKNIAMKSLQYPVYARAALSSREEKRKFIIFGQGRTGSTLLVDLLNSSPSVYCDEELFFYKMHSPARYVEGKSRLCKAPVYGFKAKIYQLSDVQETDPALFMRRLHRNGWTIIHIERENLLRHSLSAVLAEQRQLYQAKDEIDLRGQREKEHVPVELLIGEMQQRERFRRQEAAVLQDLPHIPISYEADLADSEKQQRSLNRIFEALGVPSVEVYTNLRRINSKALHDDVANYDELVSALDSNGYEKYLHA